MGVLVPGRASSDYWSISTPRGDTDHAPLASPWQPPAIDALPYPGVQTGYSGGTSNVLNPPGESGVALAAEKLKAELPPGARDGFFQKAIVEGEWLARTGQYRGLGFAHGDLKAVFALPCPTVQSPLLLVPGYGVYVLDGPAGRDVPPTLHEAYFQFRWLSKLSDGVGVDVSFSPGVFSDFQQQSSDAVRYNGYVVSAWDWTPKVKVVAGLGYFDRLTTRWLPIGGLILTPDEDSSYEIIFPKPRLAKRVWREGGQQGNSHWLYLAGETGGNAWAFARQDGRADVIDISDWRVYLGWQRKPAALGLETRFEIGYVFGRKVKYQSGLPEFYPADTVMVRGAVLY